MFKNKINILSFFILLCAYNNIIASHTVFIIIHGTWGSEMEWYTPHGYFFDTLEQSAFLTNAVVTPFQWSGKNSIQERNKAALNLAKLIETYEKTTKIIIAAHSHGGTVALLAANLIQKNKIHILYTLGTPISSAIYPNMETINFCYNLFSFEDMIQTVLGMFAREHQPHERIGNIRVFINGIEPDHSELHHPLIGQWLPFLHKQIIKPHLHKLLEPSIIYFSDNTAPIYVHDLTRKELLERDRQLSLLLLNSFRNSFEIGSKIPFTNL